MDLLKPLDEFRESTMDDYNPRPVAFVAISIIFAASGALLGRGINKLVGPKSTLPALGYRIVLNTLLLLCLYMLLPWGLVHQIQANLPGALFAGVLISSQTWL